MERFVDFDALTGISNFHDYDHQTKVTTIRTTADVEPVLERNKLEYNDEEQKRAGIKAGFVKIASIPMAVIHKWKVEDGIDVFNKNHAEAVRRKLNDPEWRYLRTASGRY
jgi:hypothetical protein|tara:strand:- start:1009 stop:1338 length:330 start_codon:yes stop_codon:yes gene_type:complete